MARVPSARASIQPVDPRHPQPRHVQRAVAVLEAGGLVCYPTDTYYGIGCDLFQKKAIERLALLKRGGPPKPLPLPRANPRGGGRPPPRGHPKVPPRPPLPPRPLTGGALPPR